MNDFFIKYKWYVIAFVVFLAITIIAIVIYRKKNAANIMFAGLVTTTDPLQFQLGDKVIFTGSQPAYQWSTLDTGGTQPIKKTFSAGDTVIFSGGSSVATGVTDTDGTVYYVPYSTNTMKGEKRK